MEIGRGVGLLKDSSRGMVSVLPEGDGLPKASTWTENARAADLAARAITVMMAPKVKIVFAVKFSGVGLACVR